jgi:hypothetical protein
MLFDRFINQTKLDEKWKLLVDVKMNRCLRLKKEQFQLKEEPLRSIPRSCIIKRLQVVFRPIIRRRKIIRSWL